MHNMNMEVRWKSADWMGDVSTFRSAPLAEVLYITIHLWKTLKNIMSDVLISRPF